MTLRAFDEQTENSLSPFLQTTEKPTVPERFGILVIVFRTICPVPSGERVRSSFEFVVISVAAPENMRPVEPIDLFERVWVWFANTKVSSAVSAGIVANLEATGAIDVIVVVFVVPRTIWFVELVRLSEAKVGDEVAAIS